MFWVEEKCCDGKQCCPIIFTRKKNTKNKEESVKYLAL